MLAIAELDNIVVQVAKHTNTDPHTVVDVVDNIGRAAVATAPEIIVLEVVSG